MTLGAGVVRAAAAACLMGLMIVAPTGAVAQQAAPEIAVQPAGPASVAELAARLSDAVVNIGTVRQVAGGGGMPFPDLPEGSPLRDLFDQRNPNMGQGEQMMREARSLGSGFIISADGIVVTNNHVIDGAEEVQVFLPDGSRYTAEVLGIDEKTDLAVLRIDAGHELPFVEFGDSDEAQVGDWVMAIGNPFGLGGSVTLGIVSARNRDISSGPYDDFIQTDAAINQGNSGGPLFDMHGRVVGINTAIIARGGQSLGIGFAVPVNMARAVIGQLAEFGETRRGWLGVGIQDVSEDIALVIGRENTFGALVVEVTPGGPSDGVLSGGDVILTFDGQPVRRMRDLPRIVALTEVGRAVEVTVLRDGIEQAFDITLGRLEDGEQLIASLAEEEVPTEPVSPTPDEAVAAELPPVEGLDGVRMTGLNNGWRAELGIAPDVEGVLILDVAPQSAARDSGLGMGLVIEEVDRQPVRLTADVTAIVDEAREAGRPAVLLRLADPSGNRRYAAVRLE